MQDLLKPESPPPTPPRKRAKITSEKQKNKILNRVSSPESNPVYSLSWDHENDGDVSSEERSDKEYKVDADSDSGEEDEVGEEEEEEEKPVVVVSVKKVKQVRRKNKEVGPLQVMT